VLHAKKDKETMKILLANKKIERNVTAQAYTTCPVFRDLQLTRADTQPFEAHRYDEYFYRTLPSSLNTIFLLPLLGLLDIRA